tara:strand:- start:30771 stop:32399 length:1629 start_codon:yes stop_codon:yes gene_type:complete
LLNEAKKSRLVIVGKYYSDYPVKDNEHYYFIGASKTAGSPKPSKILNNHIRLNKLAETLAKSYTDWVYGCNALWLKKNLVFEKKLSLFFLSDFSSKRTTVFNTYNDVINLILLKQIVKEYNFSSIIGVGLDQDFLFSLNSCFRSKKVQGIHTYRSPSMTLKNFRGDLVFFLKMFVISWFNFFKPFKKAGSYKVDKLFLTRFPMQFKKNLLIEEKYGQFFSHKDKFVTNIMTDGMHQSVSLLSYFRLRRKLKKSSAHIILDNYLMPSDVLRTLLWIPYIYLKSQNLFSYSYLYEGIDISYQIRKELKVSIRRIWGLLFWPRVIRKSLKGNSCNSFIYHLHEFPYGRLFSYVLSDFSEIKKIGFEHGVGSPRYLLYYLSAHEVENGKGFLECCPLPDKVLAESERSKKLYEKCGYKRVSVMDRIYRLEYLDKIKMKEKKSYILIAGGLHDGTLLLEFLIERIKKQKNKKFLFKPHPKCVFKPLVYYSSENLSIVSDPIESLYPGASKVIVTDSSVGYEANYLGIPVEVANIRGVINQGAIDLDV